MARHQESGKIGSVNSFLKSNSKIRSKLKRLEKAVNNFWDYLEYETDFPKEESQDDSSDNDNAYFWPSERKEIQRSKHYNKIITRINEIKGILHLQQQHHLQQRARQQADNNSINN